jgi:uncharacterized protein DUF4190
MTQQADPRLPVIDTSVEADTTTPSTGTGTGTVQPAGWPPTAQEAHVAPPSPPAGSGPVPPVAPTPAPAPMPQGPMPQGPRAPLNTLAWVAVVVAFVVSPVAIALGIVARKQIARTGERGRGLATLGAVLGAVFTAIGIATTVLVLVLATQLSAAVQAAGPVPAVETGAPVASAPSAAPAGSGTDDTTAGQAQLMAGFIQVGSAADTMSSDLQSHRGDLDAMQQDFSAYRDSIVRFRTTATTVGLSPEVRAKVDADLVPAIDRTLADLDALSTSQSQSRLSDAADRLEIDSQAMVAAATAAVGG